MTGRRFVLTLAMLAACSGLMLSPATAADNKATDDEGFISLFDGKTLDGWKSNEHEEAVRVEDGALVVGGSERSHIFYVGPVGNHDFKDFDLKLQVMTKPGSNSGVYVHTKYEDEGWPTQGYECQVNNSQQDWRRTGSLYAIEDVRETKAKDDEWFDYDIIVRGKKITLKVNGETTVEYTEPDDVERPAEFAGRKFSHGT
ncbi:MAG: DUF1080 domain-containing protein, partial [Pirellulales bacterium]